MKSLGNRISELRELSGLSQGQLAIKVGKSRGLISFWETDSRKPNNNDLVKLASIFDVSTDYLLGNDEIDKEAIVSKISIMTYKVPVYGRIPAGVPFEAIEDMLDEVYVPDEIARKKDLFGLKIVGDSMNKIIPNGMIGIFQKTSSLENGEIGAIMVNGYDATVKKFYKLTDSYLLEPCSYVESYEPLIIKEGTEHVSVIGKLVWYCAPIDWK